MLMTLKELFQIAIIAFLNIVCGYFIIPHYTPFWIFIITIVNSCVWFYITERFLFKTDWK